MRIFLGVAVTSDAWAGSFDWSGMVSFSKWVCTSFGKPALPQTGQRTFLRTFVLPFAMIIGECYFPLNMSTWTIDFVFPKSVQWNHSSWSPPLCLKFSCLWAQSYCPSVMRQSWLWVLASLLALWPWMIPFLCLVFSCIVLVMVIENHDHQILRVYISHSVYGIYW